MEFVHEELSYQIIGCCFGIFNQIDGGHKERIYQKALAIALKEKRLSFEEQVPVHMKVCGQSVGKYFLDFLIEEKVIVEIKSSKFFRMADFRQTNAYLQAMNLQLALLIAFTPTSVRCKRVVNIS